MKHRLELNALIIKCKEDIVKKNKKIASLPDGNEKDIASFQRFQLRQQLETLELAKSRGKTSLHVELKSI